MSTMTASSTAGSPAVPVELPLTDAQLGLYYAQALDLANPIFNTSQRVDIRGPLDLEAFRAAVDQASAEADAFASAVRDVDGTPHLVFDPVQTPRLQVIDLTGEVDPLATANRRITAEERRFIDLARGPLVQHWLLRIGTDHAIWYMRIHHILVDGFGTALINQRVGALYRSATAGAPALAGFGSFADIRAEEQAYRASPKFGADRAFWHDLFAKLPEVVSLKPGNATTARHFVRESRDFAHGAVEALQRLAASANLAWPDILTALTAAYVARHTGESTTVLGVPHMGRFGSASARVPAMVMNVLACPVTIDEAKPLADFLIEVSRRLRQCRRHGRYRSEQLRRDLGHLGRDRRLHGPLVNILPFDTPLDLPGLTTEVQPLTTGPVDDLTFNLRADGHGGGLRLELDANPNLYTPAEIAAHAERFVAFVSAALVAETLGSVPTLTEAETRYWTRTVNSTAHSVPRTTLAALVASSMRERPSATALVFGDTSLTYGELDRESARLARKLLAQGVERGDLVGVALPRSLELVVALVAIHRAGAAYLPIDLELPAQRIATIMGDARPRLTLAFAADRPALPAEADILLLDGFLGQPADGTEDTPLRKPNPDDAAYVIYTSGSTGAPKGVLIEHDAIVNRLVWMQSHYGIGPRTRILQKTPATFDVSVWEFFLPLISGATLVIAPPGAHRDPYQLARIIREQAINCLHFVPSMLAAFLSEPTVRGLSIPLVFTSGEELPAALRDRFHDTITGELHNLYGPTEAAVDVSYWPASATDRSQPVPIGFPVWNTALYILDDRLRPVPPGVNGHLYIAGRQLARCYINRPELTAERFIPDPFGAPGERMYMTGDIARWREDGAVLFLGRADHQVKIRGLRIELGEIEAALGSQPGIRQAAVITLDTPQGQQLAAYVVTDRADSRNEAQLVADFTRALSLELPDYMVPQAIMVLDDLPLSPNGKLDRKRLPRPTFALSSSGRPATTPTERRVAELFAQLLNLPDLPGLDADFFRLGGHSLLAARLATHLRSTGNSHVSLGAIFEHPTVGALANHLDTVAGTPSSAAGLGPVIELARGDAALPPLFVIHPAGGIAWCYSGLAQALTPERRVIGIQANGLVPGGPHPAASIAELARRYADEMVAVAPHGPYHIAGWSVGGLIGHAVAVELQARGLKVGLLAMLDSYPSDIWRNEPEPPPNAALKALLLIAGHDPDQVNLAELEPATVIGFLRESGHPLGSLSDETLRRVISIVSGNNRLVRAHAHDYFDGEVLYFRAALDHHGTKLTPELWRPYVRDLDIRDVDFLHAHLTSPDANAAIAPVLSERLGAADRT